MNKIQPGKPSHDSITNTQSTKQTKKTQGRYSTEPNETNLLEKIKNKLASIFGKSSTSSTKSIKYQATIKSPSDQKPSFFNVIAKFFGFKKLTHPKKQIDKPTSKEILTESDIKNAREKLGLAEGESSFNKSKKPETLLSILNFCKDFSNKDLQEIKENSDQFTAQLGECKQEINRLKNQPGQNNKEIMDGMMAWDLALAHLTQARLG